MFNDYVFWFAHMHLFKIINFFFFFCEDHTQKTLWDIILSYDVTSNPKYLKYIDLSLEIIVLHELYFGFMPINNI